MPEDFNFKQIAQEADTGATAAVTFSEQYNTIMSRDGAEKRGASAQTPNEVVVPSFADVPQGSAKSGSSTSDNATKVPEESTSGKATTADKAFCTVGTAAFAGWAWEAMKAGKPKNLAEALVAGGLGTAYATYICRNEFVEMGTSIKNYITGSDSKK